MAEHKRGKMKNISGGVSDLICATNIFPLTRHVWPGPLQRVSCKKMTPNHPTTVIYRATTENVVFLPNESAASLLREPASASPRLPSDSSSRWSSSEPSPVRSSIHWAHDAPDGKCLPVYHFRKTHSKRVCNASNTAQKSPPRITNEQKCLLPSFVKRKKNQKRELLYAAKTRCH